MYEERITLEPINDRAKSFYHKAYYTKEYREHSCVETLYSYDTPVMTAVYHEIDEPEVFRLWDGYSTTTMRHINEYLHQNGLGGGGEHWWDSLPVADSDDVNLCANARW